MDPLYHPQQLPLLPLTRICWTCGVEKLLEENFHKHKAGKFGYRGYCKKCRAEQRKEEMDKLKPSFFCSVCQQEKTRVERYSPQHIRIVICKACASQGKHCSRCQIYKPFSDFAPSLRRHERGGVGSYCKVCTPLDQRERYDPVKARTRNLLRFYGLTPEEYEKMLQSQNDVCAICKRPESRKSHVNSKQILPLVVDHDHKTGAVRGLLCADCNKKLGILENQQFVEAAQAYLEKSTNHSLC